MGLTSAWPPCLPQNYPGVPVSASYSPDRGAHPCFFSQTSLLFPQSTLKTQTKEEQRWFLIFKACIIFCCINMLPIYLTNPHRTTFRSFPTVQLPAHFWLFPLDTFLEVKIRGQRLCMPLTLFLHMLPPHFSQCLDHLILPQFSPPVLLRGMFIFVQTMLCRLSTQKPSHTAQSRVDSEARTPAFEFQVCYFLIRTVTYSVCAYVPIYNLGIIMAPSHLLTMGTKWDHVYKLKLLSVWCINKWWLMLSFSYSFNPECPSLSHLFHAPFPLPHFSDVLTTWVITCPYT